MKSYYAIQSLLISGILLIAGFNLHAQSDTLTIRQIFDLKVGDTLIYTGYENVSQFSGGLQHYAYFGRWGFTVTGIDTNADSVIYHYTIIGNGTQQDLVVHFADSTALINQAFFSYYSESLFYNMFAWYSTPLNFNSYSLCDSTAQCSMDTFVYPRFLTKTVNTNIRNYFEAEQSFSFAEGIGVYQAYFASDNFFLPLSNNPYPGSATIQLIYYHSDSTIWMDTADYILSGINEITSSQPDFKIFPNPSTGDFYLETGNNNLENSSTIMVYDLQSRLIYQQKLENSNNKQLINLPNVADGLYVVSVENPSQGVVWRGRLVKL